MQGINFAIIAKFILMWLFGYPGSFQLPKFFIKEAPPPPPFLVTTPSPEPPQILEPPPVPCVSTLHLLREPEQPTVYAIAALLRTHPYAPESTTAKHVIEPSAPQSRSLHHSPLLPLHFARASIMIRTRRAHRYKPRV